MYNILSRKSRSTNKFSLFATENICFIDGVQWQPNALRMLLFCFSSFSFAVSFFSSIGWFHCCVNWFIHCLGIGWFIYLIHTVYSVQCPVLIQWQNKKKNYYLRIPIDGEHFIRFAYMRTENHPCVCQSKEFLTHNSEGGSKNWFQCNAILSLSLFLCLNLWVYFCVRRNNANMRTA